MRRRRLVKARWTCRVIAVKLRPIETKCFGPNSKLNRLLWILYEL